MNIHKSDIFDLLLQYKILSLILSAQISLIESRD